MASAQVLRAPILSLEEVREIIEQAIALAHEYAADETVAGRVFEKACDLLGQRATAFVPENVSPIMLDRTLALR